MWAANLKEAAVYRFHVTDSPVQGIPQGCTVQLHHRYGCGTKNMCVRRGTCIRNYVITYKTQYVARGNAVAAVQKHTC